jgi:hypothetical protein
MSRSFSEFQKPQVFIIRNQNSAAQLLLKENCDNMPAQLSQFFWEDSVEEERTL